MMEEDQGRLPGPPFRFRRAKGGQDPCRERAGEAIPRCAMQDSGLVGGLAGPPGSATNREHCYPCNRSIVLPIYPVAQRDGRLCRASPAASANAEAGPHPTGYGMHTSRFEVRPVRPLARPGRAPPRFVTLAKAGVHPWLRMLPQPVESRANRLRLPRKPRLGPGSEAGATDGGVQYKANGNRCVNPVDPTGEEVSGGDRQRFPSTTAGITPHPAGMRRSGWKRFANGRIGSVIEDSNLFTEKLK